MRLATTTEMRDVARQAYVTMTGCCYDYRYAWTNKTKDANKRNLGFRSFDYKEFDVKVLSYMNQFLEKRGLYVENLRATDNGYIRCTVAFEG